MQLENVVRRADQRPFTPHLRESPQQELPEATRVFDLGEEATAVTYVAGDRFVCPEERPSREYLQHILKGGRHQQLPEAYMRAVEEGPRWSVCLRGHDLGHTHGTN
jgi:hypothetical protein